MKVITPCVLALSIALSLPQLAEARKHHGQRSEQAQQSQPGQFDYYVLSLSWSPDYCASHANDTQQCGTGKPLGFVLHGLWPQFEKGYPSSCSNVELPADVKQQYATLYPSPKLMQHEWEKHGTCSGLAPADYLALSKKSKDAVNIPQRYQRPAQPFRTTIQDVQKDFSAANPGYASDGVSVTCAGSGRFLQEVRLCLDKSGKSRSCASDVIRQMRSTCRQPDFLVQSIR
jgi:ribonuclease T2